MLSYVFFFAAVLVQGCCFVAVSWLIGRQYSRLLDSMLKHLDENRPVGAITQKVELERLAVHKLQVEGQLRDQEARRTQAGATPREAIAKALG